MGFKILAIDPGSTSTKIALFDDEEMLFESTLRHSHEELSMYDYLVEQFEWRLDLIVDCLQDRGYSLEQLSAVVGRGGVIKPIVGGVYLVNQALWHDSKHAELEHASNLGALIARSIADQVGVEAYIVNPVVVDEMQPEARISGLPKCERRSIFHALNTKAVGDKYARSVGKRYDSMRLVVAHLGGGVTVGAHLNGRVVDTTCGLSGNGSFSPERAGRIPLNDIVELCFSGEYTQREIIKLLNGSGGMVAHLGTNSVKEVMERVDSGDEHAKLIIDAFIYNVAKDIGAMSSVLDGSVDAILITGGVAYSEYVIEGVRRKTSSIAPVVSFPGEFELEALAYGALSILRGEAEAQVYQ